MLTALPTPPEPPSGDGPIVTGQTDGLPGAPHKGREEFRSNTTFVNQFVNRTRDRLRRGDAEADEGFAGQVD